MDDEYPEKGEIVIGTVVEIFSQGAFITLDEYDDKKGMLHISEISLKWVRNIRDYVREGQKVVLHVLDVSEKRGHIDLSLRRVADSQRKNKLQEVKQSQRSRKLLSLVAQELGEDEEKFINNVSEKLLEDYDTVYAGLEAITVSGEIPKNLKLGKKEKKTLLEHIQNSIKPPFVEITGYVELQSFSSNGLEDVKKSINQILEHSPKACTMNVSYVSAPMYRISVRAPDYKKAENALKNGAEQGIKIMTAADGIGEFHRELKKK